MFGLINESSFVPCFGDRVDVCMNAPVLIQGVEEYETVCPVNPFTGHRDSIAHVIMSGLGDSNRGLVDTILVELPIIKQMDVPDDVKIDTLVSKLDCVSFAERDAVSEALFKMSDILFDKRASSEQSKDLQSTIEFSNNDVSVSDANI